MQFKTTRLASTMWIKKPEYREERESIQSRVGDSSPTIVQKMIIAASKKQILRRGVYRSTTKPSNFKFEECLVSVKVNEGTCQVIVGVTITDTLTSESASPGTIFKFREGISLTSGETPTEGDFIGME